MRTWLFTLMIFVVCGMAVPVWGLSTQVSFVPRFDVATPDFPQGSVEMHPFPDFHLPWFQVSVPEPGDLPPGLDLAEDIGGFDGLYQSDWLGLFALRGDPEAEGQWIYSYDLGWQFHLYAGSQRGAFWSYDLGTGRYMYLHQASYPWAYDVDWGWIYFYTLWSTETTRWVLVWNSQERVRLDKHTIPEDLPRL